MLGSLAVIWIRDQRHRWYFHLLKSLCNFYSTWGSINKCKQYNEKITGMWELSKGLGTVVVITFKCVKISFTDHSSKMSMQG
jgi:hypothetical protein